MSILSFDDTLSLDVLSELQNWEESALIEYINRIAQELHATRSQQIQLGRHVEQLSKTVDTLLRRIGTLTHRHDQLDAKVCALVQDVDEASGLSRQAMQAADTAWSDVKHLREETFRAVEERLISLQQRTDEFVGGFVEFG